MTTTNNDHFFLVAGKSKTGKSTSLRYLKNPEGVMYLNCENGKKLPFKKSKFKQYTITDPYEVYEAFIHAETDSSIHTIVIDTLTYLMDLFESTYIVGQANTMKGWSNYAQYFKKLMQINVAQSTKNVIFNAHTKDILNENEMITETAVPVKGALKNNGIESYFTTVIGSKKMSLEKLKPYESKLLNITEKEEILGFKHVFQTMLTKETVNEAIGSPDDMWTTKETYIDNNVQHVIDRLQDFYK